MSDRTVIPELPATAPSSPHATELAERERRELRQRVVEASVLYKLSELIAAPRDLQQVLAIAARSAAEVMGAKATAVRLLSEDSRELLIKAVYNLSDAYLKKGPILVAQSELARRALSGEIVYVENLATDPRTIYRDEVRQEGIHSMLSAPLAYKGRAIGTIRIYTGAHRRFSESEGALLRAVAHLMAAAIEHARIDTENLETQRVQRQLRMASAVQRRMMPSSMPKMPPFDIAARYEASLELGGDFFDFIQLEGHLGIAVCDVVGKGIAASLLMAAVRSALRAYAQELYDIDDIMSRVNVAMSRDTLDNEFATLFYCVLDPRERRLTYCDAGHEPPILVRGDKVIRLDVGGMIIGVDPHQVYERAIIGLEPGDWLVIYTDGLTEARNFVGENFGRDRIEAAVREAIASGMTAQTALKHILWRRTAFTGLKASVDDTTIVVVRVTDEKPAIAATPASV